jgi:hypothetical protein
MRLAPYLLVAGSIVGCADPEAVELDTGAPLSALPADQLPAPLGAPLTLASARHPSRWVGQLRNAAATCPAGQNAYIGRKLFATPGGLPPVDALARYCVYEAPVGQGAGAPTNPQGMRQFRQIEPDLMVLAPSGALFGMMADEYGPVFDEQVGRLFSLGATPPGFQGPRVVVFDSSPTAGPGLAAATSTGTELHGQAINQIVRRLICDQLGVCVATPATRLVLDLRVDPVTGAVVVDRTNGGTYGTPSVLAEAVHQEVEAWRASGVDTGLLLNLSLGWHPSYGGRAGTPVSSWPVAVQAAHLALAEAACSGAVTFAAAGNRKGGSAISDTGPLLPGGWEAFSVGTASCATVLASPTAVVTRPMVHAVGISDGQDSDVTISRPNGRPGLVAYGDHAMVPLMGLGGLSGVYTGTSVSTAVATASAAVLWANKPALTPVDLVATLRASGAPSTVPISASFCPGGGCGAAVVVDVCRTVERSCEVGAPGYTTPCAVWPGGPLTCPNGPPTLAQPDPAELTVFAGGAAQGTLTFSPGVYSDPVCGRGVTELVSEVAGAPAADPCPDDQYYQGMTRPWLEPQPLGDQCPECYLQVSTGQLYLDLPAGFSRVSSLTLTTLDAAGVPRSYTTTAVPTSSPAILTFANPALLTGTVDARLTAVVGTTSYASSLYVLP